jgi:nicotinate-nucleotide adenylyltransferase
MLGIYGGTFDPVHFGHLRPALDVKQALKLKQVRFIPVGQPPHREEPGANSEHRIKMLELATETEAALVVDDREIRRGGASYMVDTLLSLRNDFKQSPLCLIIGYDVFLGLTEWYQWEKLITLAHLVVTHRPGWNWQQHQNNVELKRLVLQHQCNIESLEASPQGGLVFVPVTALSISSTQIRQQIQRDESVSFLLPERVAEYIQQHQLYR